MKTKASMRTTTLKKAHDRKLVRKDWLREMQRVRIMTQKLTGTGKKAVQMTKTTM